MSDTAVAEVAPSSRVWIRRILWCAFVAFLALTAGLTVDLLQDRSRREQASLTVARSRSAEAAGKVEACVRDARIVADDIARDLSSGSLAYADLQQRVRRECEARADIDGIAVAFEPFVHDPSRKLYQTYLSRGADGSLSLLDGATYDYTLPPSDAPDRPKTAWYHTPLTAGPTWQEPFLATGAGRVLIEYGVPFFRRGEASRPAGVVTIDFSLGQLQELLTRLELGDTGYGIVCTGKGTYLAHPDRSQVVHGSAFGRPGAVDPGLEGAIRRALAGASTSIDYLDPVTGLDVWMLSEPIPSTGWALALVIQKEALHEGSYENFRRLTLIALASAAALLALLALSVRVERGTTAALWTVAGGISVACVAIIVLVWALAWSVERDRGVAVVSRAMVDRYIERHRLSLTRSETLYTVPTGIDITAISFPDVGSVLVGGRIWQRWSDSIPSSVKRGFVLPQHMSEEDVIIQELARTRQGPAEEIVWRFSARLQQSFDPSRFPFDRRDVAVLLDPAEIEANVVLVPDLGAYPVISRRALPGIDRERGVLNWQFRESFFSYRVQPAASLGLAARESRPSVPALYFNVAARRHFLGPFIAYLVPTLVAAALAFAFLMMRRAGGGGADEMLNGLSYVAALFFVVVVTHSGLRDNIGAVSITYLEHVFILLYVVIGLVVFDAFVVAHHPEWRVVRFRQNLPAKLLYWPLLAASSLLTTLMVFLTR